MALDDNALLAFMQQTTKTLSSVETHVADLNNRLFGNGQPGVVQHLYAEVEIAKSTAEEAKNARAKDIKFVKGICIGVGTVTSTAISYVIWAIHHLQNVVKIVK